MDGRLAVANDGIHMATTLACATLFLAAGARQIYVAGFEASVDSQLEVSYAGPDTDAVRTVIGAPAYHPSCSPHSAASNTVPNAAGNATRNTTAAATSLGGVGIGGGGFLLCYFASDPTSPLYGNCTPTVGAPHPRYPGPCAAAVGTVPADYRAFAGGYRVPPLGAADGPWVFAPRPPPPACVCRHGCAQRVPPRPQAPVPPPRSRRI